ncbi:DMT family transporter [Bosea vestrisii]|uniref:DMT family transporter n=1 Tax=Bosea vestrisii TaxID=151416 RepID=UPI0024DF88F3|nr:DMT family transporter [Bosea vestrisii]WID94210.1 DMT family transporter [Bosea vestrisii]
METLFIPLSLAAGGLLAVQAGANAQLSKATGSPFAATTIQVVLAALLLLIVAIATGTVAAFGGLRAVPWWHAIGGVATALYVASTILVFPRLGAVVAVGLFIAGQMLASLGLDSFGLLGVPQQTPRPATLIGTLAVLVGVTAIVFGQKGAIRELSGSKLGWMLLALVAGAVLPIQGAINGLLRHDLGAPFVVGTISFVVATLSMITVLLVTLLLMNGAKPQLGGLRTMPWWGWIGAVCGATYVTTVFTAIPAIGTAATVGLTVAGQQIVSLFVDRHGWFRLPQREISALRFAGVVVLLLGVAAIKVF